MSRSRWGLAATLVLAAAWAVSGRQGRTQPDEPEEPAAARSSPAAEDPLEDRLAQSIHLPFAEATSLADVAGWLEDTLNAQVVLDRAAMKRRGVSRDSTMQLELKGVRLRTALRLLLDQIEMTYRLEPADNLVVLTDARGAGEPLPQILDELEALHRDIHLLQDTVDELYDVILPDEGPSMRDPSVIEKDLQGPFETSRHRTRPG